MAVGVAGSSDSVAVSGSQ